MADEIKAPKRSTRDVEQTRTHLEAWLREKLPGARIAQLGSPSGTGMSSETLLFDATWRDAGAERSGAFVARVAPDPRDVPVFPSYELAKQFRVMQLAARGGVPVPVVRWLEEDPARIGSPFFVMERVSGRVPPDIMPYPMTSWLKDASAAEQRALQNATIAAIARLHAIDPNKEGAEFLELALPGATALRRHVENQRRFYDWMRQGRSYPLIERTFAWLEAHWPADEGDARISWGDSRIGNVMYDGFAPAAVLDWEMAALGPRGLDLGWLSFMHAFFQMIAVGAKLPGMPDFLRAADVAAEYARLTSQRIDLRWYEAYAALRHGIIMARIHARSVHFGEATWPADLDATIPHRPLLEQMLSGAYWR
ncbi:MAG: phosphotransferase family protein [Deltaproteobacteria bacterium]|nr:phosphotransferase family protein [Deltaproteobacteria bacterium]